MNRSTLRTTLSLAALLAATGARAQNGMPADCPMHAEHQRKAAEATAATGAVPSAPIATETAETADHAPASSDRPAHAGHSGNAAATPTTSSAASAYARMQERAIAALSEEEIAALRAGSGHGLALPAEINHYPGPRHLLDLAGDLGLDARSIRELQAIYDRMHAGAVTLGERIISGERELDRLFADGRATGVEVARLTAEIARLRGELRATHLVAHVEAKSLLTVEQVARYDQLRGYDSTTGAP